MVKLSKNIHSTIRTNISPVHRIRKETYNCSGEPLFFNIQFLFNSFQDEFYFTVLLSIYLVLRNSNGSNASE